MGLPVDLEPIAFDVLAGFAEDDLCEAFRVFRRSAEALVGKVAVLRPGVGPDAALLRVCRAALADAEAASAQDAARRFFEQTFRPHRLRGNGFVTAYYEPVIAARRSPDAEFAVPVPARPADLVTLNDAPIAGENGEPLTSARRRGDGGLEPYPDRRALEDGPEAATLRPIAFLRDRVELFLLQVQGSGRLRFADGSELPVTYDGRNGRPYTSIGRVLIERGIVAADVMSLDALKAAIRAMGAGPGEAGARLMQENRSFVFFCADESPQRRIGPIGGAGVPLTPLRSIAIDRSIWPYATLFWISAALPEATFARLTIAQDTGSAILGAARADLFFGAGDEAGARAGRIRHPADFVVLLPRAAEGDP
ncbi:MULTISPECIES: murein transglycosylase A [Methylosinus]|uniref:peptidoglycan lytic exotransglycosylase n=1 Tax=Methylosinus trichosporium (strain ATCC 35070 / NCIMB 11131 / UNIQEM 75 / OB3b) TaxID=595536 RepID=A0A2D2D0Z8_METT3|nr:MULTISPECIES: MltA domain-containing protein [Methylosinus]ATQ68666.1 transglycosylase [Methylosinus trichosporium OB3b]OBS53170.1 transglycosylase [Methylosinus sp. 3S-1]